LKIHFQNLGNAFPKIENQFPKIENPFPKIENAFPKIKNPFPKSWKCICRVEKIQGIFGDIKNIIGV
jgi:hypothetical protein